MESWNCKLLIGSERLKRTSNRFSYNNLVVVYVCVCGGGNQCLFIYFIPCVELRKLLKEKTSNPTEANALFHCSEYTGDVASLSSSDCGPGI